MVLVPVNATAAAQPAVTNETGIAVYSDTIRSSFTGNLTIPSQPGAGNRQARLLNSAPANLNSPPLIGCFAGILPLARHSAARASLYSAGALLTAGTA